ncbi:MAG: V-type ATP synthase subunit A [Promethearchaeota archaeon]
MKNNPKFGYISAINGSLIEIKGFEDEIQIHNMIEVVEHNIIGEVIQIYSNRVIAQCFENTNLLKLKDKVIDLKEPISMELAPGLLANIFDGIQRPLESIFSKLKGNGFLERGIKLPSLSRTKKWHFVPMKKKGDKVEAGDIIGTVQETLLIKHKVMIPPGIFGNLTFIANEGDFTIVDEIYKIKDSTEEKSYSMLQKWPININRPYKKRIKPMEPLITGLRVIDLLFPLAKGGTVAVPGGFGTGKTVIQQSLAKWSDADVIIYCGVGERGNEIADVLSQFKEIIDPKSGRPLLERIVIIANTSNMPVSAREASIFSGVTIGEYYRDMGYNVAVLADSTSRWAEALREISGLLEEMPAEEGYPAYLPSKLSSFYERAGLVHILGSHQSDSERLGSLTIIGSVSPPSGDFSEPVTATTKRFVQAFWALDAALAYSKHYPAINWLRSYSNYPDYLSDWWKERDYEWEELKNMDWNKCRIQINTILSTENELKNITQLIGKENLPEDQQLILFIGNLIRNSFLIQSAFDKIDSFTQINKLLFHIKLLLLLYDEGKELLKSGFLMEDITKFGVIDEILRISTSIPNEEYEKILKIKNKLLKEIESLKMMFGESRERLI